MGDDRAFAQKIDTFYIEDKPDEVNDNASGFIGQKASIQFSKSKWFTVIANNVFEKNSYIQSVRLNSNAYTKTFITLRDITQGVNLYLS